MNIDRYNYEDLRLAAIGNPSQENLSNLGEWFQQYGMASWNGKYWDADGYNLYPMYSEPDEYGDLIIVGYELR